MIAAPPPASAGPDPAGALRARLTGDPVLSPILAHVVATMRTDPAHDLGHVLRVAAWAEYLVDTPDDRRQVLAAALLHDVVNVPKSDPARGSASERSAQAAGALLASLGWTGAAIGRVTEAIRQHSWSRGEVATSPVALALRDADRLEALGILGTFRCISTAGVFQSAYVDIDDPWADARELADDRFAIDHFFVKLLRLAEGIVHPAARAEAARRLASMHGVLTALGHELRTPWPGAPSA
ncbi:MAG: HD domain-containing protein [Gemmatimonadaceae bacterium]|nr:HD domain-containing protein [Gemmatimonadaceae bacterium]